MATWVILKREYMRGHTLVHQKISRRRGKASAHLCVDCGKPAHHWSYNYSGAAEVARRTGNVVARYSTDPDQYDPRCRQCHHRFDARYHTDGREAVLQWVLDRDPLRGRDGYGTRS